MTISIQNPISAAEALQVGIVGLGHMGEAFARNLLADGYQVLAFNRSPERRAAMVEAGARPASSLAQLSVCNIVLSSVTDDEALHAVTLGPDGLVDVMRQGATHVSMSTVSPDLARRLERAHLAREQHYISAPVWVIQMPHEPESCLCSRLATPMQSSGQSPC